MVLLSNTQVELRLLARTLGDRARSPSTIVNNQSPQQVKHIQILVSRHVTVEYSDAETEGVAESPMREAVAWAGRGEAV